jgi:hypothetical protein
MQADKSRDFVRLALPEHHVGHSIASIHSYLQSRNFAKSCLQRIFCNAQYKTQK